MLSEDEPADVDVDEEDVPAEDLLLVGGAGAGGGGAASQSSTAAPTTNIEDEVDMLLNGAAESEAPANPLAGGGAETPPQSGFEQVIPMDQLQNGANELFSNLSAAFSSVSSSVKDAWKEVESNEQVKAASAATVHGFEQLKTKAQPLIDQAGRTYDEKVKPSVEEARVKTAPALKSAQDSASEAYQSARAGAWTLFSNFKDAVMVTDDNNAPGQARPTSTSAPPADDADTNL